MSKPLSRHLIPTFKRKFIVAFTLVALLALTGLIFVSARSKSVRIKTTNAASVKASTTAQRLYVRPGALWPQLRWNLKALGDRLERPGKEQIAAQGTLTRHGVPAPIVLNVEPLNRLTLAIQTGIQSEAVQFDGAESSWTALTPSQRDLVETLMFDTAESFFLWQMVGAATRCLGFRFRADMNSTSGPFHDIYAITPHDNRRSIQQGTKLFFFNSDTRLLDRVQYEIARGDRTVRVEVAFDNWTNLNGQAVAQRIERREDGTNVMTIVVNGVAFSPGTLGGRP